MIAPSIRVERGCYHKKEGLNLKTTNEKIAELRKAMLAAGCEAYLIPTGDPHASEYLPLHYNAREYFFRFQW
jgi:Xaa-Pro aminopeptidase